MPGWPSSGKHLQKSAAPGSSQWRATIRDLALARTRQTRIDLGPLPGLIGYVLRRAQMVVFQDFFRTFARFGIRPAQFSVLTVIERNPGLRQSEVSAALGIKRTNFVGLLNAIEKRGLAERRPAKDRRSHALYLTPAGEALMRRMRLAI